MARLTQPLREEHAELLPHIEQICTVADMVGDAPVEAVRTGINEVHEFLAHHLIPHAQAEEAALYPVVAKAMGAPQATATMSRDHVEVGRLANELTLLQSQTRGTISKRQEKSLRSVLYGLYALVKVHFAKEEEVYLPLLDAKLTPEQARQMFEAMEQAAQKAKAEATS
jgi:iron-sulfur cluster repair protein YtfE (RIC family)